MSIKKRSVVFNDEDPHQLRILQWVESQTTNFSGFVKTVLYGAMQGNARQERTDANGIAEPPQDNDAIMDIL